MLPPLKVLNESFLLCNEQLKLDIAPSISNVNRLISFISVASKSPSIPSKWVLAFNDTKLANIGGVADRCSSTQDEIISIRREILKRFDKEIFELDYYPLLKRFRGEYSSGFRSFKRGYKEDIKTIRLYLSDESKLEYSQALDLLKSLKLLADKKNEVEEQLASCRIDLNDYYCGEHTDYKKISDGLKFAIEFKKLLENQVIPNHFVEKVCEDEAFVSYCATTLPQLSSSYEIVSEKLKWVQDLFDESVELEKYNIGDLILKLATCKDKRLRKRV